MYFSDHEHENNYMRLMELYGLQHGQDVQYESAIYIAAFPEIFKCINLKAGDLRPGKNPLYWAVSFEDKDTGEDYYTQSPHELAPLTGSTTQMCKVGNSLFNGYPISLDSVFGSVVSKELKNIVFQAMTIRSRSHFRYE